MPYQYTDHREGRADPSQPPCIFENSNNRSTVTSLSRRFIEIPDELLGGILRSLSETLYVELLDQQQCQCSQCGALLNRKRKDAKRYNTLQGSGTLEAHISIARPAASVSIPLDNTLEMTRAFY